ncbi:MAG: Mur ligase family protein, partial [Thermodesulfovibrionales bacterium]
MTMDFRGKRVTVVGIARSGAGAANLLSSLGAEITVTDRRPAHELEEFLSRLLPEVKKEAGGHPEQLFTEADLIVISPGVPLSIPPLKRAAERGIPIIGELELAYMTVNSPQATVDSQRAEFLAITGTNGKSTTTMLVSEMMKAGGFNTLLGGNIGYALTEEIYERVKGQGSRVKKEEDEGKGELAPLSLSSLDPGPLPLDPLFIIAEVSSFQLETIASFRPKGATILNITPDHLDRYSSMEEYTDAKCRVFMNQGAGDFLLLNADDPMTGEIVKRVKGQGSKVQEEKNRGQGMPEIYFFSREKEVKGAWFKDGVIRFNLPGLADFSLQPSAFPIQGV